MKAQAVKDSGTKKEPKEVEPTVEEEPEAVVEITLDDVDTFKEAKAKDTDVDTFDW